MKKEIIIGLVLLIIIIVIIILKPFKKRVVISDISKLSFSYSTGYAMYSSVLYEINYQDDKYLLKIKPDKVPDEEAKEYELDEKQIQEIINILTKYNVSSWNGFDKVDKNVLDGNSFTFKLVTKSGEEIYAHGYMKWPNNYKEVKNELNNYFMNIYKEEE